MIRTIVQARAESQQRRQLHMQEWQNYFKSCWQTAKPEAIFKKHVRLKLGMQYPLGGMDIFEAWARHSALEQWVTWRTKGYLTALVEMGFLNETHILKSISRRISFIFAKETENPASKKSNPDAAALEHLAAKILERIRFDGVKGRKCPVSHSIRIFQLIGAFTGAAESHSAALRGPALKVGNGLANYLVAHVNDLLACGVLNLEKGSPPKVLRKAFSNVVPRFIQVLENSNSPCKDSLALLQQQSKLQEEINEETQNGSGDPMGAVAFQQTVPDLPISRARAALVAFLSSLLTGRPKADDGNLRTFLDARYHNDVPTLIVDLIVASFHALAAAVERKDNQEVIAVHRSFLANKLPLVLEDYSPLLFGDKKTDHFIGLAMKQVDECFKDTILQPRTDSDPKQRFLLAAALVGLIKESQITSLLGHAPTQGPPSTRYLKKELVRQCQEDSKRIDQLVNEMVGMEGNTGPIALALLDLIYISCAHRQTMVLQGICNALLRKPVVMNYLFLFADARILLQPLCSLLDNWPTEDSSAEQHHGYDEFGSIFLFVMVCRHRYDLPISALSRTPSTGDASSPESFVLSFLRIGCLPKTSKQLDDSEKQHLSGWIKGLFESNGISDETMSNCSPKNFYMLVATLVDQSLLACQTGALSLEVIKGGFDFFYEPWLLPSLVPVLSLFSSRLFGVNAESTHVDIWMRALALLVKPPKLAPDVLPIHGLLLSLVALPLARSLFHVKKMHPRQKDVQPLLDLLLKYARAPVTNSMVFTTYSSWLNTKGGLEKILINAFQELLAFNNNNNNNSTNSSNGNNAASAKDKQLRYDHRLMYHISQALGARKVLKTLLDQAWRGTGNLKQQEQLLDTLTGVIAANNTDSPDGVASLRDALQMLVAEVHVLARRHHAKAEFLVRLHRRVEAHCSKPAERPPVISALDGEGGAAHVVEQAELDAIAAAASAGVNAADVAAAGATDPAAAPIGAGDDMMTGIEHVSLADAAQQFDQLGSAMDMNDMENVSFNDFIQDMDMLGGQSVDDIFASL